MARLRIIGHSGDTGPSWEIDDQAAVREAERIFEEYRKRGYAAVVTAPGTRDHGRTLTHFDPKVETVTMLPAICGG